MKPKPFLPEPLDDAQGFFFRDKEGGQVWHRVFHRPLYADTDRSSVVYHANYLRYFELGRATLMRDIGYPYREVEDSGYVYPIVDLGIRFNHPLHYDDPMWVYTRPSELERVRVRFDYIITHAETGQLVCQGFTLHCALNATGKVTAVDPKTVHMWKTFPR